MFGFKELHYNLVQPAVLSIMTVFILAGASWQAAHDPFGTGNPSTEGLESQIEAVLAESFSADAPGAAVLAIRDGKVIFRGAIGVADLDSGAPLTPDMLFDIGSMTKQFTAAAVMLLVEDGKVELDAPVSDCLTQLPQYKRVAVRHLLTHTSGVHSYTEIPEWFQRLQQEISKDELVSLFNGLPLDFEPGSQMHYSNSGYYLLGMLIEKASGKSYEQFLDERIFKPMGLTHTICALGKGPVDGCAKGYSSTETGEMTPAMIIPAYHTFAAGGLYSTVDDLARWDKALFGGKLLNPEDTSLMSAAYALNDGTTMHELPNGDHAGYGFGFFIGELEGRRMIYHGGGIPGFVTHALYLPESKIFVAVLCNTDGSKQPPQMIAERIASLIVEDSSK